MASNRHKLARLHAPWLIALSWLAACGARTPGFDWEDDGAGGSSGRGGSSAGGGQAKGGSTGKGGSVGKGGSAGKGSVGGFPGKGGSPGTGGNAGCVGVGCEYCFYAGNVYEFGQTFPAGDGCNTCTCLFDGSVSCTQLACNVCSMIEGEYRAMLEAAKSCDPAISFNQCSTVVSSSMYCGCPTYVNSNQVGTIDNLFAIESKYYMQGCAVDVICEPCAQPSYAYCAMEGRCIDVF